MGWTIKNALTKLEKAIEEKDWKKVKEVKKILNTKNIIFIEWSYEDVLTQAEEMDTTLTKKEAIEILQDIENNNDAGIGINWDVIQIYIENFKN